MLVARFLASKKVRLIKIIGRYLGPKSIGLMATIAGTMISVAVLYLTFFNKTRSIYFSASNQNISMMEGGLGVALQFYNAGNTPVTINKIYSKIISARNQNPVYSDSEGATKAKSLPDGSISWQPILMTPVTINSGKSYTKYAVICIPHPFFIQSVLHVYLRVDFVDYMGSKLRTSLALESVKWASILAGPNQTVIGYNNVVVPDLSHGIDLLNVAAPVGSEAVYSTISRTADCSDDQNPLGYRMP